MSVEMVLWNTETGEIRPYPRVDGQAVEGLEQPPYRVLEVVRVPPPDVVNPAVEIAVPIEIIDSESSTYIHTWRIDPLPPVPDWATFKATLLAHPAVGELLVLGGSEAATATAAYSLAPVTLAAATGQNLADFAGTWGRLRTEGLVSAELVAEISQLAAACHLPEEFIALLGGEP